MRARLILPLVAIALAACGGDNGTGIKPPVDTQTITVTNAGFDPATLDVVSNTKVIWQSTGRNARHFVHRDDSRRQRSEQPVPSRAGGSVNTTFLQVGTYTYKDSLNAGNTGTITVHN